MTDGTRGRFWPDDLRDYEETFLDEPEVGDKLAALDRLAHPARRRLTALDAALVVLGALGAAGWIAACAWWLR